MRFPLLYVLCASVMLGVVPCRAAQPEELYAQAETLRKRHDLPGSEKLLRRALEAEPDSYLISLRLAHVLFLQTRFKESLQIASELARRRDSSQNEARALLLTAANKGMLALSGGVMAKISYGVGIRKYLERARTLAPELPETWYGRGTYELLTSENETDLRNAQRDLEKCLALDPGYADAYGRLAQLAKERGDTQGYEANLRRALQLDPGNELALDIERGTDKFGSP